MIIPQWKRTLNTSVTGQNKPEYVAKTKRQITKKPQKKFLFLATCLSVLFSHSSAFAADVSIRADGTTIVNSKPFFPFGFYHVSPYDNEATKRLNALRKIADAGFNTMFVPLDLEDGSFVDEATRLGVYIIGEFNDNTISVVNTYKKKPAILGWLVADDADNGKQTPEQVFQFHNQVKVADPQHVTYLSGYNPKKIGQFMNSADLVAMQSYPVNFEPLSSTDYSISGAVKTSPSYRPIIANLQTFAWQGSRAPSFKEVRNMTYQSLINGVKGVIYYTYYDSTWDMSSNPNLWNGIKSLVPEIKQLSPTLLDGQLTKINTGVEDVFAGFWKYQNQAVVVVINTSRRSTRTVSIPLPSQRTSGVEPMFSGRPSGMAVIGSKLSGSIKPEDVHVYSFKL